MNSPLNLIPKLWNIAARIPFIQKPLLVGQDMSRTASFLAQKSAQIAHIDAVYKCQTLENKFELFARFFGTTQIKYEIISFLEFAKAERPEHLCEIGTADGGTNFLMSQALPSARLMIGVELYVKNKVKLHYFSRQYQ
jgi:tRNA G46 methylase TrmB